MPDHEPDVAAVLAEAPCLRIPDRTGAICHEHDGRVHPECALAALTAAGYVVVRVPEGVAVEHGARLVDENCREASVCGETHYTIEDTS